MFTGFGAHKPLPRSSCHRIAHVLSHSQPRLASLMEAVVSSNNFQTRTSATSSSGLRERRFSKQLSTLPQPSCTLTGCSRKSTKQPAGDGAFALTSHSKVVSNVRCPIAVAIVWANGEHNLLALSDFAGQLDPPAFERFMLDRPLVERYKLQFEQLLGTAQGLSPLIDDL